MSDYIEFAVPTDTDYWTREEEEIPDEFFERVEKELAKFVARHWPGFEFDIKLVPEATSYGNRTRSSLPDDEEAEMIASINHWMSTRWPDWLAECY